MVHKYKVLVVDDDPSILESVSYVLNDRGFQVFTAVDGDMAMVNAKKYKPNVILLDVNMPKKSGYYVATLLDMDSATKGIPIILLTGTSNILGGNIVLKSSYKRIEKPFLEDDLVATIIDAITF